MPEQTQKHRSAQIYDELRETFSCTFVATGVGATWIRASGELDLAVVGRLRTVLQEADAALVVLDLADVGFMDTSGVHALVEAGDHARAHGRRLVVAAPGSHVTAVLEHTGASDLVDVVAGRPPTPRRARGEQLHA